MTSVAISVFSDSCLYQLVPQLETCGGRVGDAGASKIARGLSFRAASWAISLGRGMVRLSTLTLGNLNILALTKRSMLYLERLMFFCGCQSRMQSIRFDLG